MHAATYAHHGASRWSTAEVHAQGIRDARTWARQILTEAKLPDETVDDAVLIVSELLTSVLHHAPGEAEVTLLVEPDLVTITCADRDPAPVQSGTIDPASESGRTLLTADAMAQACFIRRRAGAGKRVIALLDVPQRGQDAEAEAECGVGVAAGLAEEP
jgi:anti-sigma regulatory factor (Ser/Thr protein kinase)